jgi:hypothetical protein
VIGKAVYKVPGGKLLRVSVEYDGGTIREVRFSGDFFIHPEDALERVEAALKGAAPGDIGGIIGSELADAKL